MKQMPWVLRIIRTTSDGRRRRAATFCMQPDLTGRMLPNEPAFAFGDIVRIQTKLIRFNGVKMDFEYAFYSAEGVLYAHASTKHGFVDRDFRPVMLQNALEREYSNIMSYISKQV